MKFQFIITKQKITTNKGRKNINKRGWLNLPISINIIEMKFDRSDGDAIGGEDDDRYKQKNCSQNPQQKVYYLQ